MIDNSVSHRPKFKRCVAPLLVALAFPHLLLPLAYAYANAHANALSHPVPRWLLRLPLFLSPSLPIPVQSGPSSVPAQTL